jgi:predicted CopG family antitoxin
MVKVISLSDEAYNKLRVLKRGRSFSEVIVELTGKKKGKKNLADFYGIWAEDADEWKKIEKDIYENRKKSKTRDFRF